MELFLTPLKSHRWKCNLNSTQFSYISFHMIQPYLPPQRTFTPTAAKVLDCYIKALKKKKKKQPLQFLPCLCLPAFLTEEGECYVVLYALRKISNCFASRQKHRLDLTHFFDSKIKSSICFYCILQHTYSAITRLTLLAYNTGFLLSSSDGIYTGRNCIQKTELYQEHLMF